MSEEKLTIASGHYTTSFALMWSKVWADLLITTDHEGGTTSRFLLQASPAILREIAGQLEEWAEMLESDDLDAEERAIAERDAEILYYLKKRGEDDAAELWDKMHSDKLPAVLKIAKRKFKRLSKGHNDENQ